MAGRKRKFTVTQLKRLAKKSKATTYAGFGKEIGLSKNSISSFVQRYEKFREILTDKLAANKKQNNKFEIAANEKVEDIKVSKYDIEEVVERDGFLTHKGLAYHFRTNVTTIKFLLYDKFPHIGERFDILSKKPEAKKKIKDEDYDWFIGCYRKSLSLRGTAKLMETSYAECRRFYEHLLRIGKGEAIRKINEDRRAYIASVAEEHIFKKVLNGDTRMTKFFLERLIDQWRANKNNNDKDEGQVKFANKDIQIVFNTITKETENGKDQ